MKKLLVVLLALTMVFSFAACGGGEPAEEDPGAQQGSAGEGELQGYTGDDGSALSSVSEKNYVEIGNSLFGVDMSAPDGWTFVEVSSPNGVNNMITRFTAPDGTDPNAALKLYFDQCLAAATDGVYTQDVNWDTMAVTKGETYTDFDTFFATQGTTFDGYASAMWIYDYDGKSIQAAVNFDAGTVEVTLSLLG